MNTKDESFWLVWGEETQRVTRKQTDRAVAISEAERLSRKCPGKKFWVVRAEANYLQGATPAPALLPEIKKPVVIIKKKRALEVPK